MVAPEDDSRPPDDGADAKLDTAASAASVDHDPIAAQGATGHFPDDGGLARGLRKVDRVFGFTEQVVLVALLAAVVLTATLQTIAEKGFGTSYLWSFEVIRGSVLGIAMIGAAFATYQQRNLAMDLVSRRLAPRGRMVLRIVLGLITIFIAGVFTYGGLRFVDVGIKSDDHLADILTAWAMPIGGGLIIFHSLIQLIIEVDYLVRGKLTPDRERTH